MFHFNILQGEGKKKRVRIKIQSSANESLFLPLFDMGHHFSWPAGPTLLKSMKDHCTVGPYIAKVMIVCQKTRSRSIPKKINKVFLKAL